MSLTFQPFSLHTAPTYTLTPWIENTYSQKGEMDQGIKYGMMAVENAPTPADKAWAGPALAYAYCRDEKFEKAIEILEAMLPVYRAMGDTPEEVGYGILLGEAYSLAGEHEKAQQVLRRCIELAERFEINCYKPSGDLKYDRSK